MSSAQIIIVGGGISGLINAILLSRQGLKVILFEKNNYPFHRVCGEYISNEVIPFLKNHHLFPEKIGPSAINQLEMTSVSGKTMRKPLDLGGFGISRYRFDQFLIDESRKSGVTIYEGTTIRQIHKEGDQFMATTGSENFMADFVIGAQGKRSSVDRRLERDFLDRRSPYVGVKYHLKADLPGDMISLHNFEGGYCGVNKIEDDKFNLCYLIHRDKVRARGGIQQCEEGLLFNNPHLRNIFEEGEFLFERPLIVNEVAFSAKGLTKNGVVFSGDAAGTIAPFSGNGMAMAMRSAKYLSTSIIKYWDQKPDHQKILNHYSNLWQTEFASRISRGRKIQMLFGNMLVSEISVELAKTFPSLVNPLLKMTHGEPFD